MTKQMQVGAGSKKTAETAMARSMKELLKDYEIRAERYETTVSNSIRKQIKKALDDDQLLTRFLVDPQDRRPVEYWDDEKLIKALQGDPDESAHKRKKVKQKHMKEDKPLVKVLPLIDAIRARRYTHIQEFYVWDCHMENDDSVALAGIISRGCYPITRVELIDCFLDNKSISILVNAVAASKTMKELCLDFNDIGEKGCRILCAGLSKARFLMHLSLCYCGLTKQCGFWIGNLVVETTIRELLLDGNPLEAEGVIALLSQLSEAAESEGFERVEEIKRKQQALEDMKRAARINLDRETVDLNVSAEEVNGTSPVNSPTGRKRGKRGKRGGKPEPPSAGPQISVLKLADTGINHMGRGGNFAPVRCMQLLKSIISHSKDLQEIDLFANEIGDLGARQILEGLIARKDAKLPQIGVRMGHRINQDTFDIIHKLAPGPKKKGKGKKRK
ncbi:Leucine rich repeat ribonuclease inhibitor subtype [Paragonimus westermani]|uniref:Leucine rich repeat ribonuclease inhibitor subtype n=1 Tax=Paragonimus westermani TaxID=34504 RepID=A0A8T0DKK8_9TREM|nr:Leucine rich repeat ribonuclease inhibitor subtype [Paragonimus westermani]